MHGVGSPRALPVSFLDISHLTIASLLFRTIQAALREFSVTSMLSHRPEAIRRGSQRRSSGSSNPSSSTPPLYPRPRHVHTHSSGSNGSAGYTTLYPVTATTTIETFHPHHHYPHQQYQYQPQARHYVQTTRTVYEDSPSGAAGRASW